jgi:conjugal transfer pilus assembly protein TraI
MTVCHVAGDRSADTLSTPQWNARANAAAAAPFSYPPVDPGLPPIGLDQLMDPHRELLARIRLCYGSDPASFETEVLALVRRYAALVHLLPATPASYFSAPGGLFRMSLETAFYALQGTDAHIFSGRATIAVRRHLEPRWRLATFIAGLCAEISHTFGQVVVTDRGGREWPAYLQGLYPWLVEHRVERYFLQWLPDAPHSTGRALFCLPLVVPASILQHLAQGNAVVVPHMLASLSGVPLAREHNIVDELVRKSAALVIDRFLRCCADRLGKPVPGSHLERYLVDALRRLVATDPAWKPNAERSRVWYGADGLFIVWPNAATDVRKLLEADRFPGIPKSAETMLEILLGAGVLHARPDGKPSWEIRPPGAKAPIEAVRVTAPAVILTKLEHQAAPLPAALLVPTPSATADRPTSTSAADTEADRAGAAEPPPISVGEQSGPGCATAAATSGQQLQLQVSAGSPTTPDPPVPMALASAPASQPTETALRTETRRHAAGALRLQAPLRLSPQLCAVITDIVQALDAGDTHVCAGATSEGLFIALAEFERRHIEPSHALRGLSDARMLARGPREPASTVTRAVRDQDHLGLLVAPRFLVHHPVLDTGEASA